MNQVWAFIVNHRAKIAVTMYFIFVTAVHTMPATFAHTHPWAYAFLHDLAGGLAGGHP